LHRAQKTKSTYDPNPSREEIMSFRSFTITAACLVALTAPAFADTNVIVIHISENPTQKALWEKIAQDYNASHKGVNVQVKYLENEAFKAKLPTMLQSDSRPDIFYSWAMDLMGQWLLGMQGPNSTSGKGLPQEDIGILSFPIVPGGKGKATDTLGGINGWLVSKSAPPEAVDLLKFFSQEKYAKEAAASAAYIPVVKGVEASFTDPLFKRVASDLAATTYHQNYFRPGPRSLRRSRYQRRIRVGRRRRDDSGGSRRRSPGRG
jgi:ABC-type glycerol-3-phosphate transport system substrate-binding protein